jgi:DNA-binding PadR family transcriptional regulator
VNVRDLILGLLSRRAMTGYDIKRFLKSLSWLIGSPSFGSLYPALHALLRDQMVVVEVISREGKPPRKLYTITDAGREAIRAWTARPAVPDASLKAFVMQLLMAGNVSRAEMVTRLQRRRSQVASQKAELEETVYALGANADLGQRLALVYALAVANAELAWQDATLAQLSAGPRLPGAVEGAEVGAAP